MNILVLNAGSSSMKCAVFRWDRLPDSLIKPIWQTKNAGDLEQALKQLDVAIDCVGHRVVHGGDLFKKSIVITEEVKQQIGKLANLAPLHNRADLEGIEIAQKNFPNTPQIAVFDTAFHQTLPKEASIYPIPFKWTQMGIHRFGFHGINYQYCSHRISEIFHKIPHKMVICHLGSGASLCGVKDGKSVDTTMGFTPLEGLMMGTRSGTIDPGIILHLLKKFSSDEIAKSLNEQSGLLGVSGISSDMRDIVEKKNKNERAKLAFDMYVHRLVGNIGSMVASLGGIEVLVFTGGIGEHEGEIRAEVCERLQFLGIEISEKDGEQKSDRIISTNASKIKVFVIHAQEEFEIAKECWKNLEN